MILTLLPCITISASPWRVACLIAMQNTRAAPYQSCTPLTSLNSVRELPPPSPPPRASPPLIPHLQLAYPVVPGLQRALRVPVPLRTPIPVRGVEREERWQTERGKVAMGRNIRTITVGTESERVGE